MSSKSIGALRVLLLGVTATFLAFTTLLAGNLEPDGPPAPTMKTLDEVASSWSRLLSDEERFERIMHYGPVYGGILGILDRETGLVWGQRAGSWAGGWWRSFIDGCYSHQTPWWEGGRKGWRPPAVHELATLIDSAQTAPALPVGHPFEASIINERHWSSTTAPDDPTQAYYVDFTDGQIGVAPKESSARWWCVRGP